MINAKDLTANLFNRKSQSVFKCELNDFKTIGVYAWKVTINNLVAAESNTEVRKETQASLI